MSSSRAYVETFGLEIIAGRNFGKEYGTDHLDGYLLNEKAVKTLGWNSPEEAVGQSIGKISKAGKVVGVVKDFSTRSLQNALEPLLLDVNVGAFTVFGIRLKNSQIPNTLEYVGQVWKTFFPEKAFEYTFLDDQLQMAYLDEGRLARLIGYFAGIAIFLSCFGLFGLISFTVRQKSKEIGIRKILGATVGGIVALLSKDYLKLVLIALTFATPMAWYIMTQWLDEFAYHINISGWVFALSGAAALAIAFFTVSLQSVAAALANPVNSLRNE